METPVRDHETGMSSNMSTFMLDTGAAGRSVKRPRPVKSCTECRKRKLKCDRLLPCSQCQKSHRICKYATTDHGSPGSDGSDVELGERPPKRLTSRPGPQTPNPEGAPAVTLNGHDLQQITTGLIDEFSARLERLEQLVIAKDSPGIEWAPSRPPMGHRVSASSATVRGLGVKGGLSLRTRFFGQNSTRVLLDLFDDARDFIYNKSKREGCEELFMSLHKIHTALQEDRRKALAPITVFVDSMMPVQKRMADILPRKAVCDRLLEAYIETSEGIYRVIHIPTLRKEYDAYWEGSRSSDGFLARLLCMMCIGSRFETDSKGLCHDRSDGVHIPTACALVRAWLDNLRGKQIVDLGTLQAEVLLLHAYRMIAPRYQNTWTQLGLIARMAMTMGLHRDPSEFAQISPFLGEIRRRLWYTIMDMDLHVALACNLPNAVREGEYSCRPPRNIDDADLYPDMRELPPPKPLDHFTDSQLQVYAASTLPFRMKAINLLCRLDTVRDYSEVLEVGTKLERILDDVNYLFPRNPTLGTKNKYRDWRMRALLDMHVRRPLLALYRPFALSAVDCPAHITSVYLKSSMAMLTYMEELDPDIPGFSDVSHMYHVILKHDISQAAFSVCYFIKKAVDGATASPLPTNQWLPGASPEPSEAGYSNSPGENRLIWSPAGMTKTIERTMETLVGLARDASTDVRDVIALAVVLGSVQPAVSAEQRLERMRTEVKKVLETCLDSFSKAGTKILSGSLPGDTAAHGQNWYNLPKPTLLPNEIATNGFPDDYYAWDIDFWNPGATHTDDT